MRIFNTRGVTLVELMVVIAVLGILAALVGPGIYRTIERQRSAGVAREFANVLRTARNQAMSRGEIVVVEVTQANGGTIITNRTFLPDAGGNYQRGGLACDTATPCPEGSDCNRGYCFSDPARSCRQIRADAEFLCAVGGQAQSVDGACNPWDPGSVYIPFDLRGAAGEVELVGFDDLPETTLCFSPDGRILNEQGAAIAGDPNACDGENTVFVLGNEAAPATARACNASVEDREFYDVYRVSVPYNGAIQVR